MQKCIQALAQPNVNAVAMLHATMERSKSSINAPLTFVCIISYSHDSFPVGNKKEPIRGSFLLLLFNRLRGINWNVICFLHVL